MEFYAIADNDKVAPGEYVLQSPTEEVVLCGVFSRERNEIKALYKGRLLEDTIENFQKIKMTKKEMYRTKVVPRCGSCKQL